MRDKPNGPSSFSARNDRDIIPFWWGLVFTNLVGTKVGLGTSMKNYSIVRSGSEYVVRVDDKSVLKVASRRQAVRLVTNAAELLDLHEAPPLQPQAECSIAGDSGELP
jgi:hypothetical protein